MAFLDALVPQKAGGLCDAGRLPHKDHQKMNWNLFLQFVGYAFLISIYAVFAWSGKAPVEGFIVILTGALTTLGATHASASAAKRASDAAMAANPPAPQTAPTVVVKE